ncbi:hypothetical protein LMG24076_05256 [Trinickia soli]|nr:hypothetical protein LMG24076_05256 [Trinickia soli]
MSALDTRVRAPPVIQQSARVPTVFGRQGQFVAAGEFISGLKGNHPFAALITLWIYGDS